MGVAKVPGPTLNAESSEEVLDIMINIYDFRRSHMNFLTKFSFLFLFLYCSVVSCLQDVSYLSNICSLIDQLVILFPKRLSCKHIL